MEEEFRNCISQLIIRNNHETVTQPSFVFQHLWKKINYQKVEHILFYFYIKHLNQFLILDQQLMVPVHSVLINVRKRSSFFWSFLSIQRLFGEMLPSTLITSSPGPYIFISIFFCFRSTFSMKKRKLFAVINVGLTRRPGWSDTVPRHRIF